MLALASHRACGAFQYVPFAARHAGAVGDRLCRGVSTSAYVMGFGSHASDNNPEILEREKQKSLKGESHQTVPGAEGWNEKLASDSEAAVKAERHGNDMSIEDLQQHSVNSLHKEHGSEAVEVEHHEESTHILKKGPSS